MALITSDCDAMRIHTHQMALITSNHPPGRCRAGTAKSFAKSSMGAFHKSTAALTGSMVRCPAAAAAAAQ